MAVTPTPTELTAVSTFGWYVEVPTSDTLTPISTFGWYLGDVILGGGDPDLILFALLITQIKEMELQL